MAERGENYWRKHHWDIIQGVSALYCAALATWEKLPHARAITTAVSVPIVTAPLGATITRSYSMPFLLWAGLIVLATSVCVPALLRMRERSLRVRVSSLNREITKFIDRLPPKLQLPQGTTADQILENARIEDNGRVEKVHHGYMHRFRNRVIAVGHELAENGITLDAEHWEIDPPEIQREKGLRHIAEALAKAASSLEHKNNELSTRKKISSHNNGLQRS